MKKHPLSGRKQSPEHIARRVMSVRKTVENWTEERKDLFRQRISESAVGRPAWNKGKPFSEEVKKKMREADRTLQSGSNHWNWGNNMAQESIEKMRQSLTGKKQSPELVKRRFDARAGYKHSLETKIKIGGANSGEGNGNWLGGISREPYALIWGSRLFKGTIRARDNHQCQNPDCRGKCDILSIHHIDYDKKNCDPKNLITLCRSCNGRANANRDFWEAGYKQIIHAKYHEDHEVRRENIS
jgi:5-methylcytosine-specific restriction endonuclease McrA